VMTAVTSSLEQLLPLTNKTEVMANQDPLDHWDTPEPGTV
jgi:hypothetical protein